LNRLSAKNFAVAKLFITQLEYIGNEKYANNLLGKYIGIRYYKEYTN
jgi:hypothetical protein